MRTLRSSRFNIIVATTLALGVGTSAAMLSLVDVLILRGPAWVKDSSTLVSLSLPQGTFAEYLNIKAVTGAVDLIAHRRNIVTSGQGGEAHPVAIECVSPNYFEILGTPARFGRTFTAATGSSDDGFVAVISERYWRLHFDALPDVLGRQLPLGSGRYTIVGVAPRPFAGVNLETVDAWVPLSAALELCAPHRDLGDARVSVTGRLRNGATSAQVAAEIQRALGSAASQRDGQVRPIQESRLAYLSHDARTARWTTGAAFLLLLISCTNAVGLMTLRDLDRRGDIAIRRHMGASPGRIFRHLLLEHATAFIMVLGGATVVALITTAVVRMYLPFAVAGLVVEPRTLVIPLSLATLCMVSVSSLAAWRGSRVDVFRELRRAEPTTTRRPRAALALLVVQSATAFVLVTGAVLLSRSVTNIWRGAGFDLDQVVSLNLDLQVLGYRSDAEIDGLVGMVRNRLQEMPGVEGVALTSGDVLRAMKNSIAIPVMTGPRVVAPAAARQPLPYLHVISPEYFVTMGTRVVRGRSFTSLDGPDSAPAMVVDEELARINWPTEEAVGQCAYLRQYSGCITVVGVTERRRHVLLAAESPAEVFLPIAQAPRYSLSAKPTTILVRVDRVRDRLPQIAAAVRAIGPGLRAFRIQPLESLGSEQVRSWRLGARVFGVFGAAGLVMGSLGLYMTLAFSVRLRRREIGLRMALGATRRKILTTVAADAVSVLAGGILVGAVMVAVASRYFAAMLFGLEAFNPVVLGVSVACLIGAGALGAIVPALRATRVHPAIALRETQ
jgi:predicted permease